MPASRSTLPAISLPRQNPFFPRLSLPSLSWLILIGAALFLSGWLASQSPSLMMRWYLLFTDRSQALWLPDYRVEIEALPLAGIDDLSGLTYDPDRGTLFAITNKQPEIIELSLSGQVLRRVPVQGLQDPEAIEYVSPGRYVVTDERQQALIELQLGPTSTSIDARTGKRLVLNIGRNGNKGFEGLAYDRVGERLYVAKERDPQRIYEVRGFLAATPGHLEITENPQRDAALPGKDLSSLYFDGPSGHLLALSDQSRLLVELDAKGRPLSSLTLKAGSGGLQKTVPQAEGVTMDSRGNLYLISEPNLFYRFSRTRAGGSSD